MVHAILFHIGQCSAGIYAQPTPENRNGELVKKSTPTLCDEFIAYDVVVLPLPLLQ